MNKKEQAKEQALENFKNALKMLNEACDTALIPLGVDEPKCIFAILDSTGYEDTQLVTDAMLFFNAMDGLKIYARKLKERIEMEKKRLEAQA